MNTKRSYLETLNAGRQRKPYTTLEQLNRSLETLEQRLERGREELSGRSPREETPAAEPRYARAEPYGQQRMRGFESPRVPQGSYETYRAAQRPTEGAARYEQGYQSLARDLDRMRGQEDGTAAASRIAGELRDLRQELHHQMTAGLHREFEALRRDIERAMHSAPQARDSAALGLEFERLSGAIRTLSEKSDDKGINLMRLEMEQMRSAIDTLAREESVQAVDRRWDDFDRRWDALETRVEKIDRRADDPAIALLAERIDQIGETLAKLPESLSLRSLEEKMRTLAGAVDHFVTQQGGRAGDTFAMIDERLDEISRAIVASSMAAQASTSDQTAFERVEQRVAELARQIEEVAQYRPGSEMLERLAFLSSRIDDIAARADLPEQILDRLGRQIALIAERVDQAPAVPDMSHIFGELEQRFELLSATIERRQGDVLEQSHVLFRDLEHRLDEVADKLDRRMYEPAFDGAGFMEAIDARFTALAQSLEATASNNAGQAALRGLESRLEDISNRLDTSATQVANVDPDLIRSLEAQVAGLAEHLSKPGTPLPEFEDIAPRIEKIEQSLAENRGSILEAAREAAESAVRSLGPSAAAAPAVTGLAQDLKTLESLTRRSDERNARTFEAIHDTLLKIVDRLGSLEGGAGEPEEQVSRKIAVPDAPTIALDEPLPLDAATGSAAMQLTPAQAAVAAAQAALGTETIADGAQQAGRRKSMLGGLARAFSGRKGTPEAQPEPAVEPTLDTGSVGLDQPLEPKLINQPLEPGSGAPDLNAIMKRVRDERGQPAKRSETDASKADFIAAARRAAQAAAAEAESLKKQAAVRGPVKALRLGDLLKARRKPILMAAAAIMLALAGLQLGKAFLSSPERTAVNDAQPAVEQTAKIAHADHPAQIAAIGKAGEPAMADTQPGQPVRTVGQSGPNQPGPKAEATPPAPSAAAAGATPAAVADPQPAASQPANVQLIATPVSPLSQDEAAPSEAGNDPATDNAAETAPAASPTAAAAPVRLDVPAEIQPAALRDAAAGGDAKAMFEIASRYAEARGVKEDMATAAKWYQKAAEQGFAPAEYRIGNFYEKGLAGERDIAKAKTWYQLAAEQGNASAMHNLAVLFAMGPDGTADNQSAAKWFQRAAELGVKDSQFNLGILAAKGVGVPQDLEASYKWFALVAKGGDKDAAAKRDEIAKALRPEQLERARQSTELWKAKPLDQAANEVAIPAAWEDAPATTASVDMKKAVQNIQRILNKNGYDAGGMDGVMGDKTKKAIMAFQSDSGLAATGEVDQQLVQALLARK
ncbi:peptidoglycan-binding protein [Mesorhizobium sp. SP-1A]|uniref:peptidoglycan-binding protein n=1 Tax=Mesorhizobium sp. SP-1A TaxID=3077840 RepID=UPI0028F6DD61|nr:peptidoglycan-binding protein [Mesorhizobium sp. SP-1A]